jgi:hypothetical protein
VPIKIGYKTIITCPPFAWRMSNCVVDTTYIYTAKNYGIIRKEFPEKKELWNLVRYNIVQ